MFLIQVKFYCRRDKKIFPSEFIFLFWEKYSDIFLIWKHISQIKKVFLNGFWGICNAYFQRLRAYNSWVLLSHSCSFTYQIMLLSQLPLTDKSRINFFALDRHHLKVLLGSDPCKKSGVFDSLTAIISVQISRAVNCSARSPLGCCLEFKPKF